MQTHLNTKLMRTLDRVLYMSTADLINATGIPQSTWYYTMSHINTISIGSLLAIANGLHIPVRRFFYNGMENTPGKRDDYIVNTYIQCYYDADALSELVNSRADITWKKAADATGVTYDSLRKSLLAVTKTPVDRFLVACEAFGIDPFTILIDPNHTDEPKRKGRTSRRSTDPPQSGDIATLNRKIDVLKADIDDLKKKYESLLSAHEALARRVSVNIENIKNCSVNIATDRQK